MDNIDFKNSSVYDVLNKRDMIKQITFEEEFRDLVKSNKISVYLGIDPTADSIHIGHFIPLMMLSYFQKCGHRPILLIGGGTAHIGDPSGKTDMRKMLSKEEIDQNVNKIMDQISKFISFEGENAAIIVNNANWILHLNYMDFIRNYGVYFNVNRMLDAECYKQRMNKGLTFFELNYMLMQSFDFLQLFEKHNCRVQIGGDDQWSNMLSGVDLIRKIHKNGSFCVTCPLLLTADGKKMGKTEKGALWLNKEKTSAYELYQYFRNIQDNEVRDVLKMLTFLPMEEVDRLSNLRGSSINEAKKIAAFEITKLIHSDEEARLAQKTSEEIFEKNLSSEDMPTIVIKREFFTDNIMGVLDAIVVSDLAPSKGQARILVSQGGITIDDEKMDDEKYMINVASFDKGYIIIKKGKKIFKKLILE